MDFINPKSNIRNPTSLNLFSHQAVMLNYIMGNGGAFAGLQINHYVAEPTIATGFTGGFVGDGEGYAAAFIVNGFNAGGYYKVFAHYQGALIINMGGAHYPAKAALHKFLHSHAVAALHLIVPGSQHIIKILAVVHVLKHINIIRAYTELGIKSGVMWVVHNAKVMIS
jgi:hypothetical protein